MSLTGELEFENVEFGEEQPIYGKLVYLLWVFFIMLVLVNLLNGLLIRIIIIKRLWICIFINFLFFLGLAVSDISLIQKEAQILSYVSRVEQIAFIESMLLGESLGIVHFRQLFQILQFFFSTNRWSLSFPN